MASYELSSESVLKTILPFSRGGLLKSYFPSLRSTRRGAGVVLKNKKTVGLNQQGNRGTAARPQKHQLDEYHHCSLRGIYLILPTLFSTGFKSFIRNSSNDEA